MNAQIRGLVIAYLVTAAAMFAGMWWMRSDRRGYFRWPVYSAMAMFLGVLAWNLLRKHALPPEWTLTRPRLLYYGALALYALLGVGVGLLVGGATRTRGPLPDEQQSK